MNNDKEYRLIDNDCISIDGRSSIKYWCERLGVSSFTLFQLLKNVGNNASQIEEFLHSNAASETHSAPQSPASNL